MPAVRNDATEGRQWQQHESINNNAIDAFQDTFGSSKTRRRGTTKRLAQQRQVNDDALALKLGAQQQHAPVCQGLADLHTNFNPLDIC
jgi:hypothetical protein